MVGTIMIPTFQVRKQELRFQVSHLPKVTASACQSQDLEPSRFILRA